MDPISAQVAAELLAAALISASNRLTKWIKTRGRREFHPGSLSSTVDMAKLSAALQTSNLPDLTESQRRFLSSPELRNVAYQALLIRSSRGPSSDTEALRDQFSTVLRLYEPNATLGFEAVFFGALLQAVDETLRSATEQGMVLSANVEREAFECVTRSHLASMARNLQTIADNATSVISVTEFESTYRQQVRHRHRLIMPPNLGGAKRVPIDDIYVKPFLGRREKREDRHQASEDEPYDDFSKTLWRTVLLGNPGGGKSTLSEKLCHDLASDDLFSEARLRRTPFLVTLREYGAQKHEAGCSIVQFLTQLVNSRYQTPVPDGAIEYLLLNDRAIVIFDGLDELLDTSYRREISQDVESFANLYPSTPLLITSRVVGYDQAPLDATEFDVYYLSELSEAQVAEYVNKWFALDEQLTATESGHIAECFISESEVVADLRSNPLMLALMCNIYKGENYIPSNRPDVYEKCSLMLFERWDRSRNIAYPLPFENHIRPAMMHLAFTIYENPSLQGGVTRSMLEGMAARYLLGRRFDDEDDASSAAKEFIEFCTGRAWVFTDVGTTPSGELLYQFTHRTFLEYFTAGHLVRRCPTPDRLLPVLAPRVAGAEWDVVAQLAVQMEDRTVESAGELILRGLLEGDWQPTERINVVSFCARCLQFLVPSPNVVRLTTEAVLDVTFRTIENPDYGAPPRSSGSEEWYYVADSGVPLSEILLASRENYPNVRSAIVAIISRELGERRLAAGLLAWHLPFVFQLVSGRLSHERGAEWDALLSGLRMEHEADLVALSRNDAHLAAAAIRHGQFSFVEGLRLHGAQLLLSSSPVGVVRHSFLAPLGEWVLVEISQRCRPSPNVAFLQLAEDLSEAIRDLPLPVSPSSVDEYTFVGSLLTRTDHREEAEAAVRMLGPLRGRALEGGAILMAIVVSVLEEQGEGVKPDESFYLGRLAGLFDILAVRAGVRPKVESKDDLRRLGMRDEVLDRLVDWAERRWEFVIWRDL